METIDNDFSQTDLKITSDGKDFLIKNILWV